MTDKQQVRIMEWIIVAGTSVALGLASWSLLATHKHASRITALETQREADSIRLDDKFEQVIDLLNRTNKDIGELKTEVRAIRDKP